MQHDGLGSSHALWYKSAWRWCYHTYERVFVASNREPILTIRRVVWVLTAGWVLFSLYAVASITMISTIVFIPFVPSTARFALFKETPSTAQGFNKESRVKSVQNDPSVEPHVFDDAPGLLRLALDTVTLENYVPAWQPGVHKTWINDPMHPFCIAANIVWLLTFGWSFALAHLVSLFAQIDFLVVARHALKAHIDKAAAVVQVCTIVNAASAVTNFQLALFILWPFGQDIRRRFLPTTLEELRDHQHSEAEQQLLTEEDPSTYENRV